MNAIRYVTHHIGDKVIKPIGESINNITQPVNKLINDNPDIAGLAAAAAKSLGAGKKSGGKSKRKPSKYNLFIKKHMKSGKTMKECAVMWKKQ